MNADVDASRPRVGWLIALGVVATLFFGVAGAFAWLAYVWARISPDARANVSSAKRNALIAVAVVVLVAGVAGIVGTVVGLVDAFGAVDAVRPDEKAQMLSNAIAAAMSWTLVAVVAQFGGVLVAFVVGVRLLRST